jgi:hypothetical protein
MKWIGLVAQWAESLKDLAKDLKIGASRDISFTTIQVPSPIKPKKQSTLEDLFRQAFPNFNEVSQLKLGLQRIAQEKKSLLSKIESTGWSKLTAENWEHWENYFVGKYHCECIFTCLQRCSDDFIQSLQPKFQLDFKELVADIKVCNDNFLQRH